MILAVVVKAAVVWVVDVLSLVAELDAATDTVVVVLLIHVSQQVIQSMCIELTKALPDVVDEEAVLEADVVLVEGGLIADEWLFVVLVVQIVIVLLVILVAVDFVVVIGLGISALHDLSECLNGDFVSGVRDPGTAGAEYNRHWFFAVLTE